MKRRSFVTMLAISPVALGGCPETESTRLEETPLPHVRVSKVVEVSPRPQSRHLVLLEPARRARLAPRLGGQVVELLVDEQQAVDEGQALAKLASDDPKGALMAAKATIDRVTESIRDNDRELKTARELFAQGAETSRTVERYETTGATLTAQLREAKGQLVRAKDAVGATALTAPFAGTITRIHTELGEYVSPQSVAMELAQLDPLAAEVPLSESEIAMHDRGGLEFAMTLRGQRYETKLEWVATEADAGTSTFAARLLLDNPEARIRAGESATVEVYGPQREPRRAVPMTAVRWSTDVAYVLRLVGTKVERVDVKVLDDSGDLVAIEGDISTEDRVVSGGPISLMSGDEVVVVDEPVVASR
jgi:RND family efflux transporter MFP subunit